MIEGRSQDLNLAAADRREESDFVARMEQGVPSCKLLISGSDDGRAIFGHLGNTLRIKSKELFDRGSIVNVQRFFRLADNIFQSPEEQYLDAYGL